jgi:AcrR family transcriptional regulator
VDSTGPGDGPTGTPTGPSAARPAGTPIPTHTPTRPLRADAERNRRLILDVAARVFAERGLSATLNDIAHEAGLGVGTVYRRFADKEALVDALFDAKFSTLVDLARQAGDAPTAGEGLRAYIWGAAEARTRDRGLAQMLAGAGTPGEEAEAKRRMLHGLVEDLVARAQAEGSVRADLDAADVPMFMLMIGAVADGTRGVADDAWQRYARLLLDALAPSACTEELTGPPLRLDQIFVALQRRPA